MKAEIYVSGKNNFTLYTDVDEKEIRLDDSDTSFLYTMLSQEYPDNNWTDINLDQMMIDNVKNTYIIYVSVW